MSGREGGEWEGEVSRVRVDGHWDLSYWLGDLPNQVAVSTDSTVNTNSGTCL